MTESGWICFEDLEVEFKVVVEPKLNFDDAISACERDNGTLASIRSASEFLLETLWETCKGKRFSG